ncbi:Zn-dependent exopeptidase [Sistotremastrum niveocremeum HHB9708]|uniref:Peptide hydrolase n=1 Tax=Sistotremastrum niveocremeum HHB9708 TaxID=1314777 RepID=A0A164PK02_9AGAM|nr:Zn-dependent exopeptidase [Sistotremastrum niveocremeum HHB9708]
MIDHLIPRFYVPVLLPSTPLPFVPVPSSAIDRVINLIKTLKFSDQISTAVNSISLPQMLNDIRFLTGEDKRSTILTRHSFSTGALTAAAWLSDRFEETGAKCELRKFSEDYAPNVICRYPSLVNTTETVILSAHYDSRGSWGSTRAPGGNDDGSGTVSLLGIARTILRKKIEFKSNVELVAFAGEEQGLVGSRAYAKELREADADITLMVQADMIAYHSPSEPQQLGLPEYIGTPEVATLLTNISSLYAPNLYVGPTRACCSDHQSFHQQGFPATQVFERAGWILDPMYHNSGDLSNRTGYDLEQVKSIAKVTFATLLHAAGFEMPAEGA